MEKGCIFPEKEIEKITGEHNIVTTSLARFCGSTGEEILAILTIRNQPRSEYSPLHYGYNTYSKKIGSKIRVLREPEERLQKIQNQIRKQLLLIPVSFASTAGKPGDSAIKNAEIHKHNPYLISLDIKDAYPSINTRRVYENLKGSLNKPLSIRCPQITNQDDKQKCIRAITHLCMSENELPQGAPTSNQILNIVLTKLDIVLETELPNMVGPHVKYSRYADDITISFPHFSTKDVLQETFETYQKEYQEDRQGMIQSFEKNTFILTDKHDLHYLQEQIKKIEEQIHDDGGLDNETKYAYISTIHQYKQQIHYTDWNIQTVVTKIIELIQKQGRKVNNKKMNYRTPQSNNDREINGIGFDRAGTRKLARRNKAAYIRLFNDMATLPLQKLIENPVYRKKIIPIHLKDKKTRNFSLEDKAAVQNKVTQVLEGMWGYIKHIYGTEEKITKDVKESYQKAQKIWQKENNTENTLAHPQSNFNRHVQDNEEDDDLPF